MRTDDGQLARVLAPLTSDSVTSIVGFTELADNDQLYNAVALFHRGRVAGLYRKLHPAIRRSVYSAGSATLVFRVGELTFGTSGSPGEKGTFLLCVDTPCRGIAIVSGR
jgi:predicted amidohydrolase